MAYFPVPVDELTEEIIEFSLGLKYSAISEEAIDKMKLIFLDSLACSIGAARNQSTLTVKRVFRNEDRVASLWGFGEKGSVETAIALNGTSLRYLDFLEYFNVPTSSGIPQVFHISEFLPLIVALSQELHLSGREFLRMFYLAAELSGKLCSIVGSKSLSERGFHHSTFGFSLSALLAGIMYDLGKEELINAFSLGTLHTTLGIIDAEGEPYYMSKNFAFPFSSLIGILYAKLAREGFTSSPKAMLGSKGFAQTVLNGDYSMERFRESPSGGWILKDNIKMYPVCGAAQSIAEASIEVGKSVSPKFSEIDKIIIETNKRSFYHVGDPAKKFPINKETADHSAFFITALGLTTGHVKYTDFREDLYNSPILTRIINKVEMNHNTLYDETGRYPASKVTVALKNGERFSSECIHPKGHSSKKFTISDLTPKVYDLIRPVLSIDAIERLIKNVQNLDKIDDFSEFDIP